MLVTYTGREFHFNNITKESINIEDIFLSLPRINRFIGHSSRAYSVGEHTLFCYKMANMLGYSTRERLLTFIHDFTEAYVGDVASPLKRLLPDFEKIEKEVELAICDYIGIEPPTEEEYIKVKRIDLTMLAVEMRDLTLHDYTNFIGEYTYLEMLDEDCFNLKEINFDENTIRTFLRTLFNDLMEDIRRDK